MVENRALMQQLQNLEDDFLIWMRWLRRTQCFESILKFVRKGQRRTALKGAMAFTMRLPLGFLPPAMKVK